MIVIFDTPSRPSVLVYTISLSTPFCLTPLPSAIYI